MRSAATTVATLVVFCSAAAPAGAATVTLTETPGFEAPKGQGSSPTVTVAVVALPGEANRLTVTRGTSTALVLRDPSAPLTPGAGCAATAPGEVTCSGTFGSVGRITVDAGDGDDLIDVAGAPGLLLAADGGAGDDTLRGGDAPDELRPGAGRDDVDGGAGRDGVFYDERAAAVTIALDGDEPSGEAGEGDTLRGLEVATGGAGDDTLRGTVGDDQLIGGKGADRFEARGGDDFVKGEAGDDTAHGGDGDDTLIGDGGRDALSGGPGDDHLAGRGGADQLAGDSGSDTVDMTGDPATTAGEAVFCGSGPRDRVDSPAALEVVIGDCERIDIAVRGQDVQPLRVYGTPRVSGRWIALRVGCDSGDCGDRVRARFTITPRPRGRALRATATLRPSQLATVRIRRGRLDRGDHVRLTVAGTQFEAGEGVPVRGGFVTPLR